ELLHQLIELFFAGRSLEALLFPLAAQDRQVVLVALSQVAANVGPQNESLASLPLAIGVAFFLTVLGFLGGVLLLLLAGVAEVDEDAEADVEEDRNHQGNDQALFRVRALARCFSHDRNLTELEARRRKAKKEVPHKRQAGKALALCTQRVSIQV